MANSIWSGLDISHWNGSPNYQNIINAGHRFVFLKASRSTSYGSYPSSWFVPNAEAALGAVGSGAAAGQRLYVGAYHEINHISGAAQAAFCWSVVKPTGITTIAADFETWTSAPYTAWYQDLVDFCDWFRTNAPQVQVLIYTSGAFWRGKGSPDGQVLNAGLWNANWGTYPSTIPANGSDSRFASPGYGGWSTSTIVQWASGSQPGHPSVDGTGFDGNAFWGTEAGLSALFPAPPPGVFRVPWPNSTGVAAAAAGEQDYYLGATRAGHSHYSTDFNRDSAGGATIDWHDKVIASAAGTVVQRLDSYGQLMIKHIGGFYTWYVHLIPSTIAVSYGSTVYRGQYLGQIGGTADGYVFDHFSGAQPVDAAGNFSTFGPKSPHLHVNHATGTNNAITGSGSQIQVKYQLVADGPTIACTASVPYYASGADITDPRHWPVVGADTNQPPNITGSLVTRTPNLVAGQTCVFTNIGFDPEGVTPVTWNWKIDGVFFSALKSPTRVFPTAGTFLVLLTATDNLGAVSKRTFTIRVSDPPGVDFDPTPQDRCAPIITGG